MTSLLSLDNLRKNSVEKEHAEYVDKINSWSAEVLEVLNNKNATIQNVNDVMSTIQKTLNAHFLKSALNDIKQV